VLKTGLLKRREKHAMEREVVMRLLIALENLSSLSKGHEDDVSATEIAVDTGRRGACAILVVISRLARLVQ
jgi:hypothetical protein